MQPLLNSVDVGLEIGHLNPGSSSRFEAGVSATAGKILVVDDERTIRELLSYFLKAKGYQCTCADSADEAVHQMETKVFDLVISDVRMPNRTGLQLLEQLHQSTPELPVIMITAVADLETAVDAMKQGAADYITKPFDLTKVAGSVANALSVRRRRLDEAELKRRLEDLLQSKSSALNSALETLQSERDMTLEALVRALDTRESETRCHSSRVQSYAVRLAHECGVSPQQIEEIARGALLHDIGKIGIADSILLKPGKLTEEEWVEMKKHPTFGYEILRGINFLESSAQLVLRHHERWNGLGYPDGLKGRDIPLGARIFAVVDSFDAMTSDRPYRKALTYEYAREEIRRLSGVLYDPAFVEGFLNIQRTEWEQISELCSGLDS